MIGRPCVWLRGVVLAVAVFTAITAIADGGGASPFERQLREFRGELAPVRAITHGPKHHWFAYYDKFQFDPTDRYVLCMEVDFEHRSPRPDDVVKIGMIDLKNHDQWIELGQSRAWCWQQGCMLQWRPGSDREVLWNDREGDRFVCRVVDVKSGKRRTLPRPIDSVSPDGRWALVSDFARTGEMRPGYGYTGIPDPNRDVSAPVDSELWKMNLDSGETTLLFSLADVARQFPLARPKGAKHYVNHVLWNPDGSRFLFLNRGRGVGTRMFTAAADGTDMRLTHLRSSHYTWRDPKTILVWSGNYLLVPDDGSMKSAILWRASNGHESYLPGKRNEWILTDTYPLGPKREQTVYLYHVPSGRIVPLGSFPSPKEYQGEWRCDTHPRLSRDGRTVCIDSAHGGTGRQLYLIDIGRIVDSPVDDAFKPAAIRPTTWSEPAATGSTEAFELDPGRTPDVVWGRGKTPPTHHFAERLPAFFDRTLLLKGHNLGEGKVEWVFTGDEGGVTVAVSESAVEITQRIYGAAGLRDLPGARDLSHPEAVVRTKRIPLEGTVQAIRVIMDHQLRFRLAINGREVFAETCSSDLTRHQVRLVGGAKSVRGTCVSPAAVECRITVDPTRRRQTMIGFGGIATPTAYHELSPSGKRRWWGLLLEYNLLIQREYPIGSRLNPRADNWDRLTDAMPHGYGDNFPNGEISDFDYLRALRGLGGKVWFEFWMQPPWTNQDWRDSQGNLHRDVVDPPKYVAAMLAYCRASKQRTGVPPDVVGIQNQRQQPLPIWREMIVQLRKGLDEAGFQAVRIHMSDAATLQRGTTWLSQLRAFPDAWAATDYVATHLYDYENCFDDPDQFDEPLRRWNKLAGGKPFLSTEMCVTDRRHQWKSYRLAFSMGQLYHKNLTLADASALSYCWTLLNVVQPSYGWTRSLATPDPADGFVPKASSYQLRVFGAFSRRVREGMVRVAAASSDPDVLICAFVGPTGKRTLIAMNRSTAPRTLRVDWPGEKFTEAELVGPYQPNEVTSLDASSADDSSARFPLPSGSILTLTTVPQGRLPDGFKIGGE